MTYILCYSPPPETPEFKDNSIDTAWLDGLIREKAVSVLVDPQTVALSAAVYKAHSMVQSMTKVKRSV
jgi:acetyl-CoA carboxylase/biotin carboxylase 1